MKNALNIIIPCQLIFLLGCPFIFGGSFITAADRPNILFILADNWRSPSAGILGDPLARTPIFDRIAREGVLFTNTFNPVPSCSPTRSSLLTGRYAHEIGSRINLLSDFPRDTPVFTQLLRDAGYTIGYSGKPWGPGNYEISGWTENPVGPKFNDFAEFHSKRTAKTPFFFWLGNIDTATRHGKMLYLEEAQTALDVTQLKIPPELPDCEAVRKDLLNYYGGIKKMDDEAALAIKLLEESGELNNTVIVYAGDNGWQMPRGLANCYDAGSHVPLAIRWGALTTRGRVCPAFVNLAELGPTFLDLANVSIPKQMSLPSLKGLLLEHAPEPARDAVFIERERHANVRKNNLSYPCRAVRTDNFLYIRNIHPDRWPAGDPDVFFADELPYGDVDTTLTKQFLITRRDDPQYAAYMTLIFGKRPGEELYDLRTDPNQLVNVANNQTYAADLAALRKRVDEWMEKTNDPRLDPTYNLTDTYPYYGKTRK